MEYQDVKLVMDSLASHGKSGCGIITLANETNITQSTLRDFLSSNQDFFCKLNGESKYTINSFGKYKGSTDKMLKAWSEEHNKSKVGGYYAVAIVAFLVGYMLGGI
jgi:hypothetical protein